jgi:phosphoribosylformylglycinamidine synthase
MCLGLARTDRLIRSAAAGVGNVLILFGASTGRDGIGGASVLASQEFDETLEEKRPSVQVGDPFTEKKLIEACLELLHRGLVVSMQDLGAAGLTSSSSEMASKGRVGLDLHADRVPLREADMEPWEIMISESQERMLTIVEPARLADVREVCARWDLDATVIGEVTDGKHLEVFWGDELIIDVPPRSVAHDGPVYNRPMQRPAYLDALQALVPDDLARPADGAGLAAALLALMASPNLCDKSWITGQYDRYVMGNTALATPDDSGVVRVDEQTGRGVAISTDCNSRYAKLDPFAGAQLALAEAYRNVATAGAVPLAISDCLNFGSPEDPAVMWQFAESVRGISQGCRTLGIPVTGGNVSLYNQTADVAIHPTPLVAVLGVMDDVARRTSSGWKTPGQVIYLLGTTADEFGGSAWTQVAHDHLGGLPPAVDLDVERRLGEILVNASRQGLVEAAHDLSEGGLAVALAEASLRNGVGARIWLDEVCGRDGVDAFTLLFSESAGRAIVAVPRSEQVRFTDLCMSRGFAHASIGVVQDEARALEVQGQFVLPLDELRTAHTSTLPDTFAAR